MAQRTSAGSAFRDGFAALWHEPLLPAAELMWRWCFGASAWALGIISFGLFLDSIKLRPIPIFLLSSLPPRWLYSPLRDTLRGSLSRFILEQAALILGLILLWSLVSAVGRAATLGRLVAMFRSDAAEPAESTEWNFVPIFTLQFLRATWWLIATVVAAGLLLCSIMFAHNAHPLRAALALCLGLVSACLVGPMLNWFLGVAPLFCIRSRVSVMEALDQTINFSAGHAARLFLLGLGFCVLRLVWAGTTFLAFLSPFSWAAQIGSGWAALLMTMMALVYFAGADLLYLARLAAYVALAEDEGPPTLWQPASPLASNQATELAPG